MSSPTDRTEYASAGIWRQHVSVRALVDHLETMSNDAVGIGEVNASAAAAAADILRRVAEEHPDVLDLENAEVFPDEYIVAARRRERR